LDFFAATSSSKGVGDNGGVIGMSSSVPESQNMQKQGNLLRGVKTK
jgi:hypothetical protein